MFAICCSVKCNLTLSNRVQFHEENSVAKTKESCIMTQTSFRMHFLYNSKNLGSITMNKVSGGSRIPVDLSQILTDDAVKVLHSIGQQIWKIQQWLLDWKTSVFIPIPKKCNGKECSTTQFHSFHMLAK